MAKKSKRKVSREPDQYDAPFEPERDEVPTKQAPKYRTKMVYLLNQDEVNALIYAADVSSLEELPKMPSMDYPTYTQQEVLALLECTYVPPVPKKK